MNLRIHLFILFLFAVSPGWSQEEDAKARILELLAHPEHAQGEMAGHMTTHPVINI